MANGRRPTPAKHSVRVNVRVQTGSSRSEITGVVDGSLRIRTTAVPADGKANADVIKQLANAYKVPRSRVLLIRGAKHREKVFEIVSPGSDPEFAASNDKLR